MGLEGQSQDPGGQVRGQSKYLSNSAGGSLVFTLVWASNHPILSMYPSELWHECQRAQRPSCEGRFCSCV